MEMQQFETVGKIFCLEQFRSGQQLRGAQAELGVLAGAFGPFAGAAAQQPRAHADQRLDAELFGDADDLAQLLELLHHHDHFLIQLGAQQRHADEAPIFVTIANDQTAHLALQRQARQ